LNVSDKVARTVFTLALHGGSIIRSARGSTFSGLKMSGIVHFELLVSSSYIEDT
jgi:hypothetical protein